MSLSRSALLWISENRKLRETLPRMRFIRRAVNRFMPGEEIGDAITAALTLRQHSIGTIFTRLGENISEEREANAVADHYVDALKQIQNNGLDAYVSLKLTHLGLDLDASVCRRNLEAIVLAAESVGTWVWIDMEQSPYVDRTLAMYRDIRPGHPKVGVCLQTYLYRTAKDLEDLLPLRPGIRLVKGAYKEPPSVAFPRKADVDANFFSLSRRLLEQVPNGVEFGVGTHDPVLIKRTAEEAERLGVANKDYEYQLLYGIRTEAQHRLAADGHRIRCLISYGSYWFPWYVRRLAERPANVWFVVKNILEYQQFNPK